MKNFVLLLIFFTTAFGELFQVSYQKNQQRNSSTSTRTQSYFHSHSQMSSFNTNSKIDEFQSNLNIDWPFKTRDLIMNFGSLLPRLWPQVTPSKINSQDIILGQDILYNVTKDQWSLYKETYGKKYGQRSYYNRYQSTLNKKDSEEEDVYRFKLYAQQKKQVIEHNSQKSKTFQKGINKFSDKSRQQFVATYLGTKLRDTIPFTSIKKDILQQENKRIDGYVLGGNSIMDIGSPNLQSDTGPQLFSAQFGDILRVDWRQEDVFNNFHLDQGQCGSCYIFATIVGIQTHLKIKKKITTVLSDQQILDCCSRDDGFECNGCEVGSIGSVIRYSTKYGIMEHASYPYKGVKETCKYNPSGAKKYLNEEAPYKMYTPGLDYNFTKLRLQKFPLIGLADSTNWAPYKSGIFNNCSKSIDLNHGVILVGYEPLGGSQSAWIIKNSFGTDWGENGYMKLDQRNDCGVNSAIIEPTFKSGI